MPNTSTIKLLNTMEWSKRLNFGRQAGLGNFIEPAVTSANIVIQTILGAPFAWPWNRAVTGFLCNPGQQDYTVVNWAANLAVQAGWLTVDSDGNCQKVTTAGTTGSSAPTWNPMETQTTTDGTAVWTNQGSIGTPVDETFSYGFVETASVQDLDTDKWTEIEFKVCLGLDSTSARPRYISAQSYGPSGEITFRVMPIPDEAYPVAVTIQQAAPVFTTLSQTWAPVPDEFSRIYNWGFLSLMWLFADDPRFGAANSKFVAQLLSASEGLTEVERNIFLHNWQEVTGQPVTYANRVAQGTQARGV